jgi:hypothetical protein
MDINIIFGVGISLLFSYIIYRSLKPTISPFKAERYGLLVAQDTGKTKHNQSKTGDASLAIERVRRRAIQGSGRADKSKIKETATQKGSTTGALEVYFISSICPCLPVCPIYDTIFDGGNETGEYCQYSGSEEYLDAGNDKTQACGL